MFATRCKTAPPYTDCPAGIGVRRRRLRSVDPVAIVPSLKGRTSARLTGNRPPHTIMCLRLLKEERTICGR